MSNGPQKDLVVLVADLDMEYAIRGLLGRSHALRIREGLTFNIFRHPERDPGVLRQAHEFLRPLRANYRYALVMFDRQGCGRERRSSSDLENEVEQLLRVSGWEDCYCCATMVLDPEPEIWVFTNSPHVVTLIADGDEELYRRTLEACSCFPNGKPRAPKEVMESLLRIKRIPRSPALYAELARQVSLTRCQDRAFQRLRSVLQQWFPA